MVIDGIWKVGKKALVLSKRVLKIGSGMFSYTAVSSVGHETRNFLHFYCQILLCGYSLSL